MFFSFPDVAIGAPYEEGGRGCIYIYQGYKTGLWNSPHYTQRVCASQVAPLSKGFGFALHGDTNFDRAEEKGGTYCLIGSFISASVYFVSYLVSYKIMFMTFYSHLQKASGGGGAGGVCAIMWCGRGGGAGVRWEDVIN